MPTPNPQGRVDGCLKPSGAAAFHKFFIKKIYAPFVIGPSALSILNFSAQGPYTPFHWDSIETSLPS
jgi:hypothetical protein